MLPKNRHTLLINSLSALRNDEKFVEFWNQSTKYAKDELKIEEPVLPRTRKPTRKLDQGSDPVHFDTPEDLYRSVYFEFLDLVINFVKDRFDQPSFEIYVAMEKVILNYAVNKQPDKISWDLVTTYVKDDIDINRLRVQLQMLPEIFRVNTMEAESSTNMNYVTTALLALGSANEMFSEVNKLIRLLFTIPVSSATAERSFSALRRLKTYTRSTMSPSRLNHVAILHFHQTETAKLDVNEIVKLFVANVESRSKTFG